MATYTSDSPSATLGNRNAPRVIRESKQLHRRITINISLMDKMALQLKMQLLMDKNFTCHIFTHLPVHNKNIAMHTQMLTFKTIQIKTNEQQRTLSI